ncbi:hypothetical protein BD626DRAFT_89995 [Schizophyllum amplum]|uniref:Centromere protein Scm3-domain-containing protein n=1 Tax=Schizophyllum amplum TaxID=97359 RepID=A0A550C8G4_9AGAR|nr:hypothetical protein BD626DRAFT_89995 [Auriculariopsis ampla]
MNPPLFTPSATPPTLRTDLDCAPPPRKRLRTVTPARFLPPDEIQREKAASLSRLFDSWASLEERYSRTLDEDDIIDLREMSFIKDRGILASSPVKQFGVHQPSVDDDEESETPDEQPEEEEEEHGPDESDDELDAFAPKLAAEQAAHQPSLGQPLTEEEITEFMEAEKMRRLIQGEEVDATSDACDDDEGMPPPRTIIELESDDELDDWGMGSEASIIYRVPKEESESDFDALPSPPPARPYPFQLYTPPRSQTSSSLPPPPTPCSEQRSYTQESPAYAPPSSPLPPSSPPTSSSPLAPSSPVKARARFSRTQSSPIKPSRRSSSPAPDDEQTPSSSKLHTPQSTPIPRLDLSKMLSSKRKPRKWTSTVGTPTGVTRNPFDFENTPPEDHSPTRTPAPERAPSAPQMSVKARGKQRATDVSAPQPALTKKRKRRSSASDMDVDEPTDAPPSASADKSEGVGPNTPSHNATGSARPREAGRASPLPVAGRASQPPGPDKASQPPGASKISQPPGESKAPQPPNASKAPQSPSTSKVPQPSGANKARRLPGANKASRPIAYVEIPVPPAHLRHEGAKQASREGAKTPSRGRPKSRAASRPGPASQTRPPSPCQPDTGSRARSSSRARSHRERVLHLYAVLGGTGTNQCARPTSCGCPREAGLGR